MNEFLTKLAKLTLGLAMAAGVGIAVSTEQNKYFALNATSGDELTFDGDSEIDDDFDTAWHYAFTKGANGNAPAAYSNGIRVYNARGTNKYGGHLTLSPNASNTTGYITSVVITATSTSNTPTIKVKAGATSSAMSSATETSLDDTSAVYTYTLANTTTRYIEFTNWGNNTGSYVQWIVKKLQINYTIPGGSATYTTTALAISGTIEGSYDTNTDSFDESGFTVTRTKVNDDDDTDIKNETVTSGITYHWEYSNGDSITLPFTAGQKSVKIWASVQGETLTTKDNATSAAQYVTGDINVAEAPVETEVTINTSTISQVTTNTASSVVFTEGIVTFTISKGTATTDANNNLGTAGNGTRVYKNSTLSISVTGTNTYLYSVVLNKSTNNTNAVTKIGTSWTGGTAVAGTGVLTVTSSSNTQTVSTTVGDKADIGNIVVTYTAPYQPVTGISVSTNSIVMTSYDEERIVASALPANATVSGVTFGGYDSQIISVDTDGYVIPTGTKFGPTTITVTSKGNKSDSTKATATVSVNITRATFKEAKYSLSYSGNVASVAESGNIVSGSSSSYSTTGTKFAEADYLQGGKEATLTISGMAGYIVKSIVMKMKSDAESGSGSFSVEAGTTTLKTISDAAFSDNTWYGSYSSSKVLMKVDMSVDDYEIQSAEDLVIKVNVSVSGFHMTDYRVRYVKAGIPEEVITFSNKVLTELTCNSQGTSAPSVSQWEALRIFYLNDENVPTESKTILFETAAATHDYDPLIDDTDPEIVAAALAKYDYVIAKYGKLEDGNGDKIYKDFINRNPAPLSGSNPLLIANIIGNTLNPVVIIVIISMLSVGTIAGYFFIRRRKEQA